MFSRLLAIIYKRFQIHSLRGKLLLPVVGLMLISLLGGTLAFVVGTALTQNQLLEQQSASESQHIAEALRTRLSSMGTAATMLASDPQVLTALEHVGAEDLPVLNSRTVVVRDRFKLDLIQVYNRLGEPRTNLVVSDLYRESALLDLVGQETTSVVSVDGHLLLLGQAPIDGNMGTVLVGIDLGLELDRIVTSLRLDSELGMRFADTRVATQEDFPFDAPPGRSRELYTRHISLVLGSTPVALQLVQQTTDITQVTSTGLTVMVASMLLTTGLLIALSVFMTRAVAEPVQQLSASAALVAKGNLSTDVEIADFPGGLDIGNDDELSLLAQNFNGMVAELRGLYANLESKVAARTHELATSAEVIRTVSSSLDLDVVLQKSAHLIQQRLDIQHVAVFLADPSSNFVVLRGAIGRGMDVLKAEAFKLPVGSRSMVGIAAATGKPRIAQDVTAETAFLRTAKLPDSGAAAAIPLMAGDTVIGVLYVQRESPDALTPEIVNLLVTLADQIAVGVKNAQLYAVQRDLAENLAEMDRIKTEFLANMSHELRTPLNSIIGFSKVMLKGLEGPLTDMQAQELQIIHDSGQHLLALINDILDVSKLNAGKMQLQFEEVDLGDLIERSLFTTSALVKEKPITLRSEVNPAMRPLYVDRRRVRQILLNLLSNAAKFTKSGEIIVSARQVEALNPHTERLEPFVEVSVRDTGMGIPKDRLLDIFKEFTQVDGSSTRRAGGTGLGLSITKALVELHGGRIWAESRLGEGSTFSFTLPVGTQDPADLLLRGLPTARAIKS